MSLAGARSVNPENDAPKGRSSGEIAGDTAQFGPRIVQFDGPKEAAKTKVLRGNVQNGVQTCTVHGV